MRIEMTSTMTHSTHALIASDGVDGVRALLGEGRGVLWDLPIHGAMVMNILVDEYPEDLALYLEPTAADLIQTGEALRFGALVDGVLEQPSSAVLRPGHYTGQRYAVDRPRAYDRMQELQHAEFGGRVAFLMWTNIAATLGMFVAAGLGIWAFFGGSWTPAIGVGALSGLLMVAVFIGGWPMVRWTRDFRGPPDLLVLRRRSQELP